MTTAMNMDAYASMAGIAFLVALTISFMYFLHHSIERIEELKAIVDAPEIAIPIEVSGIILTPVRFALYTVISIILLNVIIIILQII